MPDELNFVVLPGNRTRVACPTSTRVKTKADYAGNLWLRDEEHDRIFPGYAYRVDAETLEVFVVLNLPRTAGTELELTLGPDQPAIDEKNFLLKPMAVKRVDDTALEIRKNDRLFTTFRYDAVRPYLMPLMGPYGASVTREYPLKQPKDGTTDHIHHRSCWVAWGEVNGTDNWGEGLTAVPQLVKQVNIADAGYALCHLQADVEWMDKDGEAPQLDERRDVFVYNTMGEESLFDVRVRFTANYGDVTFGDTKEGGFCSVRVADSYRGAVGGRIENGLGMVMERECWGKKAPWCDYSGPVANRVVGVTIMDHPENYGYPTYWHVRDYGLMAANPLGLSYFKNDKSLDGSMTLPANESLEFRYRVFVHAGNAREASVADRYLDFILPPELKYLDFSQGMLNF